MKIKPLLFVFTLFLFGCGPTMNTQELLNSMYNVPYETNSEFDGTRFVGVDNCWCGKDLSFDLFQTDKLATEDLAVIKARVSGTNNIGINKSLHFNVDGKIYSFASEMTVTNFEKAYPNNPYFQHIQISTKKYLVPVSLIEEISSAKRVVAKVDLDISQTFVEGVCSPTPEWEGKYEEQAGTTGFKRFYSLLKK